MHAADIQDRDGGVMLMGALFGLYPFLLKLYADSGYQGPQFQNGLRAVCGSVNVEIVKRSELHKFVVLPKRWIVERTIAGLGMPQPKRPCLPPLGIYPPNDAKALSELSMISDGLSRCGRD